MFKDVYRAPQWQFFGMYTSTDKVAAIVKMLVEGTEKTSRESFRHLHRQPMQAEKWPMSGHKSANAQTCWSLLPQTHLSYILYDAVQLIAELVHIQYSKPCVAMLWGLA